MEDHTRTRTEELIALKERLLEELRGLDKEIERIAPANADEAGLGRRDMPRQRARPVRVVVLDALEDLGWPAYTRQLVIYCQARYGRKIASTRFGSLATDEMKAHRNGKRARSVWLCFALTYDRAEPIKRLLARSDWPLENRLVAPTTGRVQYLKSTVRLCELAAEEEMADDEMMRIFAADHARDLPGIDFRRGKFDLERWRDVAVQQLERLEPRDAELRAEAAARWQKSLGDTQLMFGGLEVIDGGRGPAVPRRSGV